MGFRTVVVLFNDQTSEWKNDPHLGENIMHAANSREDRSLGYGRVIECVHADSQTLGVLNSYNFMPLARGNWYTGQKTEQMKLDLLQKAAEELGYTLVKKA